MGGIVINKKSGIPLYLQVKNQITEQIRLGNFKVGCKMPTERELANTLNVSRNTISTAYNNLENDGIIKSFQGKGTFVMEEVASWKDKNLKEKIVKVLDLALEEAMENGMNSEEFLELVTQTVNEKSEIIEKMSFIFVECNIEQAKMFSYQLGKTSKMQVIPLTINDLKNMDDETKEALKKCEVIITTFNHVNEVNKLINNTNKHVFGVAINPDIGTIVKIARYKDGTKFGCVCISEEFIFKIERALENAGLDNVNIAYTNSSNKKELEDFIKYVDVIIVSPGRMNDIKEINYSHKDIIEFLYLLDGGSVKALKSKMVEYLPHNLRNLIS